MKSLVIIIGFFFAACGNTTKKKEVTKINRRDTTLTAVAYALDWNHNEYRLSTARRIVFDTLMPDTTNPKVNILQQRTEYQVPMFINLFDSLTKKPLRDSLGQQMQVVKWYILEKDLLLYDYNKKFK